MSMKRLGQRKKTTEREKEGKSTHCSELFDAMRKSQKLNKQKKSNVSSSSSSFRR